MNESLVTELASGITCIDAAYVKPGSACLYLMEHQGECAIIETGTGHSVAGLDQVLKSKGLRPQQVRYVIPTHVHLDHAGGAGVMMQRFPNAQLLIHPRGARHMIDPTRLVESSIAVYGESVFRELYGELLPVAADRVRAVADGETLLLGDRALEFRHARGHADHHFCVWDKLTEGWFSGDMFGVSYPWFRFEGGDFVLPATTPTQFRPDEFLASLAMLDSYQPQRIYLTHYGQLNYSAAVLEVLTKQVQRYPLIAQECGESLPAIENAITNLALECVGKLDATADRDALKETLSFDAQLNAQGLVVWLQRQASA